MKSSIASISFATAMLATVVASADPCRVTDHASCPGFGATVVAGAPSAVCDPNHEVSTTVDCPATYGPLASAPVPPAPSEPCPPPVYVGTTTSSTGNTTAVTSTLRTDCRTRRVVTSMRDPRFGGLRDRLGALTGTVNQVVITQEHIVTTQERQGEVLAEVVENQGHIVDAVTAVNNGVIRNTRAINAMRPQVATAVATANLALAADAVEFQLRLNYGLVVDGADMGGAALGIAYRHRFAPVAALLIQGAYGIGIQSVAPGPGPLNIGHFAVLGLFGTPGSVQVLAGLGGNVGGYLGSAGENQREGITHWMVGVEAGVRFPVSSVVSLDFTGFVGTGFVGRLVNGQASEPRGFSVNGSAALTIATNR